MLRMVGATSTIDDVALLVVHRDANAPDTAALRVKSADQGDRGDHGDQGDADPDEEFVGQIRLVADKGSVARARAFAKVVSNDLDPAVRGVLVLLVSEVATNCVTHAATDFTIKVFRSGRRLRVECSDYGEGSVTVERADPTETRGRGVYFVLRLADEWGVRPAEPGPGKTVWFSLSLDTVPVEAQGLSVS